MALGISGDGHLGWVVRMWVWLGDIGSREPKEILRKATGDSMG